MGRYTTVDVEVYLDEFREDELIEELESRGYRIIEDNDYVPEDLTKEEISVIVEVYKDHAPGTIGNSIYEKLRKR
jgi:hypothetical protein